MSPPNLPPFPLALGNHCLLSVSLALPILYTSHKHSHAACGPLWLASLAYNVLIMPGQRMSVLPFHGWMFCHCMYAPQLIHQLMGPLVYCGCYEWCCCEHSCTSICVNMFLVLLGTCFRADFLGPTVIPCSTFWGPAKLFSTANASCCLAAFPTSSPVLVIVCHRIVLSHVYLVGEKGGSGRWAQSSRDRVHVSWSHSLFFLPHCVSRKLSEKKMKNKLFWNYLLS